MATRADWLLRGALVLYFGASLLHFTHNAEFVHEYPNLPWWITRSSVYWVWLAVTAVGIAGYALYRARNYWSGLILIGLYAVAGLDGLLHYTLAPMSTHTSTMNFTIWFEVVAAVALLTVIAHSAFRLKESGTRAGV